MAKTKKVKAGKFKVFKVTKKFSGGGEKGKIQALIKGSMKMPDIAAAAKKELGIPKGRARAIVKGLAKQGYLERVS